MSEANMNYQRQKVPAALEEFFRLLESVDSKNTSLNVEQLQTKFNSLLQYFKDVYAEWFPKAKKCSDEHIAEQLFSKKIKAEDLKRWTKFELLALMQSFERIFSNARAHWKKSGNRIQVLDELRLLKEMTFETIVFLDSANYHIRGTFAGYEWGKRNVIHSAEAFSASQMLLRSRIYESSMGEFAVRPTSIFLLRQAIEIRLKNIFGIDRITDDRGKIERIPGSVFVELVRGNEDAVDFPVKASLLMKIYNWTQYYIHGGFIPYIWEIEWAHNVLTPLFTPRTSETGWSLYGSVQIKKSYYDAIEEKIRKLLTPKNDRRIIIHRLSSPESRIIE